MSRVNLLQEDEKIAKDQIAEDISLYGNRSCPKDAVGNDESTCLSNLPQKRSAAEFEEALDRPTKFQKTGNLQESEHQKVTAIDWNSGATPLEAWLNQSALPSIPSLHSTPKSSSASLSDDLVAKELKDLESLRAIHIETTDETKSFEPSQFPINDLTNVAPRKQVYLRNILDRYPLLPSYLALRLAEANCARADRLDWERQRPRWTCAICKHGFRQLQRLRQHQRSHTQKRPYTCATCQRSFSRQHNLDHHIELYHKTGNLQRSDSRITYSESQYPSAEHPYQRKLRQKGQCSLSQHSPDFWTPRGRGSTTHSIKSQSSERNSSLHGSGHGDPEDQALDLPDRQSRRSSASFSDSCASLPPPPVHIKKQGSPSPGALGKLDDQACKPQSFFCDICEEEIEVIRRRDWQ